MTQVFTLREVRSIVSTAIAGNNYKGSKLRISIDVDPYYKSVCRGSEWTPLPRLRKEHQRPYRNAHGYLRVVDRLISKYGPDAEFSSFDMDDDSSGFGNKPIEKGGDDDGPQTKGVGKGLSFGNPVSLKNRTFGKGIDDVQIDPSGSGLKTNGLDYKSGIAGSDTGTALPAPIGSVDQSKAGAYPGKIDSGPAISAGGNPKTVANSQTTKKAGVGSQSDGTGGDAHRVVCSASKGLKTKPKLEADSVTNLDIPGAPVSEWGIHPHPTYSTSFSAYVKRPKYKLPPISGMASSLSYS